MTFAKWIKDQVYGLVEGIVFQHDSSWNYRTNTPDPRWVGLPVNKHLTQEEATSWLSVGFDTDYGSQDCPNIYIYTHDRVYYVHEYDGSVSLRSLPRHPTNFPRPDVLPEGPA